LQMQIIINSIINIFLSGEIYSINNIGLCFGG